MSWFGVGAEVGGLAEVLFIILGPIALWYNEKFKIASFINKFMFIWVTKSDDGEKKLETIKLSYSDIMLSCRCF
jgi:hypothetical protein